MLDLFLDTERTARNLKGWRGPIMMLCGFGISLFGLFVTYIQSLLLAFARTVQLSSTPIDYISVGLMAVGFIATLYGLWVYYKDTMYQAWRVECGNHPYW